MDFLFASLAVLLFSGIAAMALSASPRRAAAVGVGGAVTGGVLGLVPAIRVLAGENSLVFQMPWAVPGGALHVGVDPLSAWFLLPTFAVTAAAALYGAGYFRDSEHPRRAAASWGFFNLLTASMAVVLTARNGILFLIAWEVMSLASYFLVVFEDENASVRRAGWLYLVATHVGTAFLFALFALFWQRTGTFEFAGWGAFGVLSPALASAAFLLSAAGFGTKAGLMPLHIWLPEAHPAAPSHVSAVLSGVMIKTGIYGLLRTLSFLGMPPVWWGALLVAAGSASCVAGILFSAAQHDLKRLLAYSSVENIGIITLGIGIGLLGAAFGNPAVAFLGIAGALAHVLNHSLMKGLLFLGAGSVLHATGERRIDRLGGLLKRMPWTGALFLIGCAAICGLPPLNGFMSEVLIYLASFKGILAAPPRIAMFLAAAMASLAFAGGLAALGFSKAFSTVFLGEPRGSTVRIPHEANGWMKAAMGTLGAGCVILAFGFPELLSRLVGPVSNVLKRSPDVFLEKATDARLMLSGVRKVSLGLMGLFALLALLRKIFLYRKTVSCGLTWDCGYSEPTARMQYTSSSFVQPLTALFRPLLRTRRRIQTPEGPFPSPASLQTDTPDLFRDRVYGALYGRMEGALSRFRWIQGGRVQLYVFYIMVTLLVLLAWKMR